MNHQRKYQERIKGTRMGCQGREQELEPIKVAYSGGVGTVGAPGAGAAVTFFTFRVHVS